MIKLSLPFNYKESTSQRDYAPYATAHIKKLKKPKPRPKPLKQSTTIRMDVETNSGPETPESNRTPQTQNNSQMSLK